MSDDTTPDVEPLLEAWLTTMASGDESPGEMQTLLPPSDAQQPMFSSFRSFRDTNSAAPLDVGGTLAEGGMGVIKTAEQSALGRTVVVKTLRSDHKAHAAEHVLREAWATGSLEHPNIVPVHDIRVDTNGAPMIVLKRIEGDTWLALMQDADLIRERFGATNLLEWNIDILRQVSQAVRFAHARGILHRDLKPENVMIGSFGEVYLVDWGIAMSLNDSPASSRLPLARKSRSMAGTPCYMAPEMLGEAPLDERTDVYLLGAMLYEILSGRPPHSTESLSALLTDIRQSEPELPHDACPLLAALCRRAMRPSPADRFASASDFSDALNQNRLHRQSAHAADLAGEKLQALRDMRIDSKSASLPTSEILPHGTACRTEIYSLFGAIRMGYREALTVWPENKRAESEMDEAIALLIQYELAEGNPRAAQVLYEDLAHCVPGLEEKIASALLDKKAEKAELERFRKDMDFAVGHRTRIFLIMILGLAWTITPLLRYGSDSWVARNYTNKIVVTLGFLAMFLALWFWARESLRRTLVNRQLSRTVISVFVLQTILFIAADILNLPEASVAPLMIFTWSAVLLNVVTTIDHRFWPALLGSLTALFVSAIWTEIQQFAMAGANFVLTCTAVYIWYPRSGKSEPDA